MKRTTPAASARARKRLDRLLVERRLLETREKAQALIMAGRVRVEGTTIDKAGALVHPESSVEIVGPSSRYVGRGGLKLEAALEHFHWGIDSKVILDIGSSTGGFVDCLLQHGAARVIAVDVGTGQLDWRLRQDPRVRLLERTNARYLRWEEIGEKVDGITMDVSFISATQILPVVVQFSKPGARLLVLVKPQFEVGKGEVGKRGIVRDEQKQRQAVAKVRGCVEQLGFTELQEMACPVLGAEGNREFFLTGVFSPPVNSAAPCIAS
ncbi:MAG TPA: TlyA family RNA methyltransferase [Terriglobales bacterium]|jgi:23S rRNA (cytidine1920-2'-O)/16S rRNA (cytidine1409-2'-O)-methyltransferase|nr:TlyA family RNA methyltransferase [Terriglobales bacterium]